jgi:hypothetical protein
VVRSFEDVLRELLGDNIHTYERHMIMDRGELGKTIASVSNYRVNIGYFIGLCYNSRDITVSVVSRFERCNKSR